MIIVKIDVMKIDKSKLFSGKNGAKYLDIVLMENRDGEDQYGNSHMAVQGVTKEERANGVRVRFLEMARPLEEPLGAKKDRLQGQDPLHHRLFLIFPKTISHFDRGLIENKIL